MTEFARFWVTDEVLYTEQRIAVDHQTQKLLDLLEDKGVNPEAVIVISPAKDIPRQHVDVRVFFHFSPDKTIKDMVWGCATELYKTMRGEAGWGT